MEIDLAAFAAFNQLGLASVELRNQSLTRPKFEISAPALLTLDFVLIAASPASELFFFFAF